MYSRLFAVLLAATALSTEAGPFVRQASAQARDTTSGPALTIEEAMMIATRNNPDHLQVVNNRRVATAARRSAFGALLPSANVSFSSQYQQSGVQAIQGLTFSAPDTYQSNYSLSLGYQVGVGTFLNPRLQAANVAAADADIAGSVENVRFNVAQQYLTVLQARAQAELQDSLVGTAATQLELAKAKVQVGSGTSLDVSRAEVDLGTQRVAALRAHNQVEIEKLRLFQRMGVMQPQTVRLTSTFTVTSPTFTVDSVLELARRGNPTLNALRSRSKVAGLNVKVAKADYLPTLSMRTGWGGYTYQYSNPDFLIAQANGQALSSFQQCAFLDSLRRGAGLPSSKPCGASSIDAATAQRIRANNAQFPFNFTKQPFGVSASLSVPIFNGFSREQRVQEAFANREDADYRVRAIELQLTADVTSAYLTLTTAARAVALQEQVVARAQEELQLAEARFRVGASTSLDVSTSRTSFERAQTDRINAIYDFHKAFAALESAVGRPLR